VLQKSGRVTYLPLIVIFFLRDPSEKERKAAPAVEEYITFVFSNDSSTAYSHSYANYCSYLYREMLFAQDGTRYFYMPVQFVDGSLIFTVRRIPDSIPLVPAVPYQLLCDTGGTMVKIHSRGIDRAFPRSDPRSQPPVVYYVFPKTFDKLKGFAHLHVDGHRQDFDGLLGKMRALNVSFVLNGKEIMCDRRTPFDEIAPIALAVLSIAADAWYEVKCLNDIHLKTQMAIRQKFSQNIFSLMWDAYWNGSDPTTFDSSNVSFFTRKCREFLMSDVRLPYAEIDYGYTFVSFSGTFADFLRGSACHDSEDSPTPTIHPEPEEDPDIMDELLDDEMVEALIYALSKDGSEGDREEKIRMLKAILEPEVIEHPIAAAVSADTVLERVGLAKPVDNSLISHGKRFELPPDRDHVEALFAAELDPDPFAQHIDHLQEIVLVNTLNYCTFETPNIRPSLGHPMKRINNELLGQKEAMAENVAVIDEFARLSFTSHFDTLKTARSLMFQCFPQTAQKPDYDLASKLNLRCDRPSFSVVDDGKLSFWRPNRKVDYQVVMQWPTCRVFPVVERDGDRFVVGASGYVFACEAFRIFNSYKIATSVRDILYSYHPHRHVPCVIFRAGTAGCGKTFSALRCMRQEFVAIVATKSGARELLEKLAKKFGVPSAQIRDRVRTFDSAIMHGIPRTQVLICDEGMKDHAGKVLAICYQAGVKYVEVFGDPHQIGFIKRCGQFRSKYGALFRFPYAEFNYHNRRNPVDVVVAVSSDDFYGAEIRTSRHGRDPVTEEVIPDRSMETIPIRAITDIPIRQNTLYTAIMNDEKLEIEKYLGDRLNDPSIVCGTTDESQGASFDHHVMVRLDCSGQDSDKGVRQSLEHGLVSITRHKFTFRYYTMVPGKPDPTLKLVAAGADASKYESFKCDAEYDGVRVIFNRMNNAEIVEHNLLVPDAKIG